MKTISVILAGGIGERFWPMSRSSAPKQLHAIGSDRSMLEETIARAKACGGADGARPMLITGAMIADKVKAVVGDDEIEIIAEPVGKNTAPAIALAAAIIQKRYDDAVMVVASADHAIKPVEDYARAVRCAVAVAEERGGLVVFGIKPSRAETGYGYIELGESVNLSVNSNNDDSCSAFKVKRFVEKPNAENAVKFMESGRFLWNSGMFVWKASTILNEFKKYMPDLYEQAMAAGKKDFSDEAIREFYTVCCKESIDFGIMERAETVSAVCGNFFWDDLGSWESLSRVYGTDAKGTTVDGSLIYENECSDSLIINKSPGRTLAAIGLKNVAVISVDDAVMVIERERLPELKRYLAEIKNGGRFPSELF